MDNGHPQHSPVNCVRQVLLLCHFTDEQTKAQKGLGDLLEQVTEV